jgi:hypothetical protein
MMTTGGESGRSVASKTRPDLSGIRSASKNPPDAFCQPTSGGRSPGASGWSARWNADVQLFPVRGMTTAAPAAATPGSARTAGNARANPGRLYLYAYVCIVCLFY